jgi:hypothetical protein
MGLNFCSGSGRLPEHSSLQFARVRAGVLYVFSLAQLHLTPWTCLRRAQRSRIAVVGRNRVRVQGVARSRYASLLFTDTRETAVLFMRAAQWGGI